MTDLISHQWRPSKKSSNALLNAGYSQSQLNTIGKVFIERYNGKELDNASTVFSKMVRSSGSGHDVKPKANGANKALEQRKQDLANKSTDGNEKAKEAKNTGATDEMKLACANMIQSRWEATSFNDAKKIVELGI